MGKGAKPAKDEADGAVETAVAEQKQLYICGWGAAGCEQSPSNAQDSEVPVIEEGRACCCCCCYVASVVSDSVHRGQGRIKKKRASGKSV